MKISREWLGDYIDLSGITDDELGVKFGEIGFPVDAREEHAGTTVFDLEITSNRVDAMSHFGIARELAAVFQRELNRPGPADFTARETPVRISIEAPELCSRYAGLVIRNVTVKASSPKIARRLEAAGLRPINNIVDATNYVMLSLGHPLHAFDLDSIEGNGIRVRRGRVGETIRSLDGIERVIDEETCVIAGAERAVALGGVIGGTNSEIGERTRNVLLECAHFEPSAIRKTARRLGISTDASYRFERGVDPNDVVIAVQTAANLIVSEAGGEAEAPIDVVARPIEPKTILLRETKLLEASASMIDAETAVNIFRRLGFDVRRDDGRIAVTAPTYRGDLHEEMDLLEELLRIFGYDAVPSSLPRVTTGDVVHDVIGEAGDRIREIFSGCGLTEVITYSFINADDNRMMTDEPQLEIANALNENVASMRLSLIPGMLRAAAHNRSYGIRDGSIFETGRTYHRAADGARERHVASVVMFGALTTQWNEPKRNADYFDVKGVVERVAERFHADLEFGPASLGWLREGQTSVASAGGRTVATMGAVSRHILQKLDLKGDVFAAEIDLETLIESGRRWTMAPVSKFPGVPMVLSMMHSTQLTYDEIVSKIRSLQTPHLVEIGLWDRFVPVGDETGDVKTALGMWYQAVDRSLTQEEVAELHRDLAARVAGLLPVRVIT